MDYSKIKSNLERLGYKVTLCATSDDAKRYLNETIDKCSVGFGGSVTLDQLGIYDLLGTHNDVYWHWRTKTSEERKEVYKKSSASEVFLSSVNGIAETGEIVNIDGTGNRVSSIQYGHSRVIFVVGRNKIAPDFESALYRARNVAAPLNAKRLHCATPCAIKGDKCYDCSSPDRICCGLSVLWYKPRSASFEVVLIDEELGY